jgi:FMN reductase
MNNGRAPLIVGVGGTQRPQSSSVTALRFCMQEAERAGARTLLFAGPDLELPHYDPTKPDRTELARRFIQAVREADGLILASPGYHGGVSGLVKNVLDYLEDTARDERPYLTARAVGCIAAAAGWQAGGPVLAALRAVVHALRGWPTPLGVQLNTAVPVFNAGGACVDAAAEKQLKIMTAQVVEFALMAHRSAPQPKAVQAHG